MLEYTKKKIYDYIYSETAKTKSKELKKISIYQKLPLQRFKYELNKILGPLKFLFYQKFI